MSPEQAKPTPEEAQNKIERLEAEVETIKKLLVNKGEGLQERVFVVEGIVSSITSLLNLNENLYTPLMHVVGYYLVISGFLNYLSILIPMNLMDVTWELNALASLINNTPAMLIGLMLVFVGRIYPSKREGLMLSLLSKTTLIAAIFFLLLLPVGVNDTIRLHRIHIAQISDQILNQTHQIDSLEDALNKASSVQEVADLMKFPSTTDLNKEYTLESAKKKATEEIKVYQKKSMAEIEQRKQEQWLGLVRDSVRYIIGIVLCAVFYFSIWRVTREIVSSPGNE